MYYAYYEICILKQKKSDSLYLSRKIDFGTPKYEVSLTSTTKNNRYIYIYMYDNAYGTTN